MTTTTADVFGPISPNVVGLDEMAQCYACQRVTNYSHAPLGLDERVSATTRVFGSMFPSRNFVYAMTQESTSIANPFPESVPTSIGVAENIEEEWVSAPIANILVVGVAPGNADVMMSAQETGQGMSEV